MKAIRGELQVKKVRKIKILKLSILINFWFLSSKVKSFDLFEFEFLVWRLESISCSAFLLFCQYVCLSIYDLFSLLILSPYLMSCMFFHQTCLKVQPFFLLTFTLCMTFPPLKTYFLWCSQHHFFKGLLTDNFLFKLIVKIFWRCCFFDLLYWNRWSKI